MEPQRPWLGITASNPAVQSILDAGLNWGTLDELWAQYRSWTNGYACSKLVAG